MKLSVATKNVSLGITLENALHKYVERLNRKLKNFADDNVELKLLIKKHERHHFYSGVFTLLLPKQPIMANVGSHDLEILLKEGFEKLEKSFATYKGKHFQSSSDYQNHVSIRNL